MRCRTEFIVGFDPHALAAALLHHGQRSDGIVMMALEHPAVREAVITRKEMQTLAWAFERPDGGRGFGFTGGHMHKNWQNDNFRKLVLNAIVWAAKIDVPVGGVPSATPTDNELNALSKRVN